MNTSETPQRPASGKLWSWKAKCVVAAALLVTIIVGAVTYWNLWYNQSYRVSQTEITERISKVIPRTVDVKLPKLAAKFMPKSMSKQITISKVDIELRGDKAFAHIEASASEFNRLIEAVAESEGTVRYDTEKGSFFFHPTAVEIKKLTADGQPLEEMVQNKAADISGKLTDKLSHSRIGQKLLEKLPADVLDPDTLKQAIHDYMQQGIQEGTTVVLDKVPLYTLKADFKQQAAKHMIYNVKIENNYVVITFSILKLIGWALGMVVMTFAVVALVLFVIIASIAADVPIFFIGFWF